jgi:hypothetical protein
MLNPSIIPNVQPSRIADDTTSRESPGAAETGVVYRLASSRSDLEAAFSLAHETYVEAGLMKPHSSGLRITPYMLFPQASIIVAVLGEVVVGTVTCLRETPIGLPHFHLIVAPPHDGIRPASAEGSNFAVLPEFRSARSAVTLALACYGTDYAARFQRIDRLVAVVHPRQARFYEGLLKYSRLREETIEHYNFVEGAPAIVDYIEPLEYPQKLCDAYGMSGDGFELFTHFFTDRRPTYVFPSRRSLKVTDCVWTPESLNYFLHERAELWEELTEDQRRALRQSYWPSEYDHVFGSTATADDHCDRRFDVFALAHVELCADGHVYPAILRTVSSDSITIQFPRRLERIRTGEPLAVTIMTDQGNAVRLCGDAEVANGGSSAQIRHRKHPIWNEVIRRLEDDYFPAARVSRENATL